MFSENEHGECKMARNFDTTPKVCQRIDFVAKTGVSGVEFLIQSRHHPGGGFAHVTDDILQCRERSPLDAILQSARTMQQIINTHVLERRLRVNLKCLNQHAEIAGLAHGT